jgi:hypothetical protein
MPTTLSPDFIKDSIQLALAPAFLLTAISSMIATASVRLGRVVDRARKVAEQAKSNTQPADILKIKEELLQLRLRGRIVNASIALLTVSALLIGLTIIVLFLGETTPLDSTRSALASFIGSVGFFLLALLAFLCETFIASRVLNFDLLKPAAKL